MLGPDACAIADEHGGGALSVGRRGACPALSATVSLASPHVVMGDHEAEPSAFRAQFAMLFSVRALQCRELSTCSACPSPNPARGSFSQARPSTSPATCA